MTARARIRRLPLPLRAVIEIVHPLGEHRAGQTLLRPQEALDQYEAHCQGEDRPTLHVRLRLGGALCTECRNPSKTTGEIQ